MRPWAILVAGMLCAFCLSCASRMEKQPDTSLPRPAPSYMHWLQKQSLLRQAPEIIAQVSQSSRVWLQSAAPGRAAVLLKAAPNWLQVDASGLGQTAFRSMAALVSDARASGFGGLYLGDTGEKPDIWLSRSSSGSGLNPASLQFDPYYGSDEDFERLAETAEQAGLEIGSALLAGATGQGPDFVLQARNASGHAGLYAMLAAPPESIPLLPEPKTEWDSCMLDKETVSALAARGIIPASLARDAAIWASPGGWAASGEIAGADGARRRWLYRYSGSPGQPVFAWQDPSGLAARVFAAAVIRHTGLLGQTLAGLRLEPLMGLEPAEDGKISFSPGMDALNDISRQIHRYGGWALQADALPASGISAVLAGPCDFCRDDVTEALAVFGLLAADGRPVAALYRDWISAGLDIARLARGFQDAASPNPLLLADNAAWTEAARKLAAAGFPGTDLAQALPGLAEETARRFILTWRLGMPGLVFCRTPSDPWLRGLLLARQKSGLAAGKVLGVTRGRGGGFGLLSKLPEGGYWLLACNFGVNADELSLTLPKAVFTASDAATGANLGSGLAGQNFRIALDGRAARNVLFQENQPVLKEQP